MADNSFKLDMFREAYDEAVAAMNAGETANAKKLFLREAELMDDKASTSETPLAAQRKERA